MVDTLHARTLSERQIEALRASAHSTRTRALIGILYETGCKVHEAVKIELAHINCPARQIVFDNRQARISGVLAKDLATLKAQASSVHLFGTRQSPHMTPKRARQLIQSSTKHCFGQVHSPQVLRYSHIAHALVRGVKMSRIQEQVGLQALRARQLEVLLKP